MQETARPVAPEVVELIERTTHEAMDPFGLRSVEVRPGADHDGDPVIFVEAEYDLSETPIDPAANAELSSTLWRLLQEAGEARFPHIRHKYHEFQKVRTRRRARH